MNTLVMNPCIDPCIALMIKQQQVTLFDVAKAGVTPKDPILVQKAQDVLDLQRLIEFQYAETQATFEDGLTCADTPYEELEDGMPNAIRILMEAGYTPSDAEPKLCKKQVISHKRYDPVQKRWVVTDQVRFIDLTGTEH